MKPNIKLLVLPVVAAITLIGCGDKSSNTTPAPAAKEVKQTEQKPVDAPKQEPVAVVKPAKVSNFNPATPLSEYSNVGKDNDFAWVFWSHLPNVTIQEVVKNTNKKYMDERDVFKKEEILEKAIPETEKKLETFKNKNYFYLQSNTSDVTPYNPETKSFLDNDYAGMSKGRKPSERDPEFYDSVRYDFRMSTSGNFDTFGDEYYFIFPTDNSETKFQKLTPSLEEAKQIEKARVAGQLTKNVYFYIEETKLDNSNSNTARRMIVKIARVEYLSGNKVIYTSTGE